LNWENATQLESIFGRWPSFHDAEVLRLSLDRSGEDGPTLDVVIHVFEMTSEVDAKGFYILKKHTEVTFRFTHIVLLQMQWFNDQNVLSSLEVAELDATANEGRRFRVAMRSSWGLEAEFECQRAIVLNVRPFHRPA
jgi:hypothetical protein